MWTNCCCWSLCSNRDSSQCFSAVVENCDVKSINYGRFFFRLTELARIVGCVGVLQAFGASLEARAKGVLGGE